MQADWQQHHRRRQRDYHHALHTGVSSYTLGIPVAYLSTPNGGTLTFRTDDAGRQVPKGSSGRTLSDFTDSDAIAPWAKDAMTLLVRTGTVSGSYGKLTPQGTTTRAEMTQVLYNLLNLQGRPYLLFPLTFHKAIHNTFKKKSDFEVFSLGQRTRYFTIWTGRRKNLV